MDTVSSARDPKEAIGFFSSRISFTCAPGEVQQAFLAGEQFKLIDVRARADYERAHVMGAINFPETEWHETSGLDESKTHVVYGYSVVCNLACKAALKIAQAGYSVKEMQGGIAAWTASNLPTVRGAAETDELRLPFP